MTSATQAQTAPSFVPRPVAKPNKVKPALPIAKPKYLTWKEFQSRYLRREDQFKYEWEDGKIEKTPYAMNVQQLYIWKNLNHFFQLLKQQFQIKGELTVETDTFLSELLHRRPDIAYFTHEQIADAIENPVQVPHFVIEVVSPSDNANKVNQKVGVYFTAGVRIVWNIYPELQEVHVYENATTMRIARGAALCSAEPVIPGFALSADAVFAR